MIHNYPAYVFRMTSLLEKLGIKNAIYVHKDDVNAFCNKFQYRRQLEQLGDDLVLTQYIASRGPRLRLEKGQECI